MNSIGAAWNSSSKSIGKEGIRGEENNRMKDSRRVAEGEKESRGKAGVSSAAHPVSGAKQVIRPSEL